jgi:hypothetical protein
MKMQMTSLRIGILILGLATAAIHFTLLFPDVMFILNALGYLAFLGLYFLPVTFFQRYHRLVRWAFIAYTLVTILAWVAIGDKGMAVGWITKAIEFALIVLMLLDGRQESKG